MDAAYFGNWDASADWVPPCDEQGAEEVRGYLLCRDCAESLKILSHLGDRRTREAREASRRYLALWRLTKALLYLLSALLVVPAAFAVRVLIAWAFGV